MKHIRFSINTLGLMLALCLQFSCSSIEQTETRMPKEESVPTSILLSKSTADVKTIDMVPQYVFKGKDDCDIILQEDTTSTKYHVTLNKLNKEAAYRFINNAYLNYLVIRLKYDQATQEVNSMTLLQNKQRTRSGNAATFPVDKIEIVKTNLKTFTYKAYVSGYRIDEQKQQLTVFIDFMTSHNWPYHFPIKAFDSSVNIIKKAYENKLWVEYTLIPETEEIASIRFCDAIEQTRLKTESNFPIIPSDACSTLTEDELKKVFSHISSYSCNNIRRPYDLPCIPFGYIEDGCFARAHAMRRIINRMGFECHKLFVYGSQKLEEEGKLKAGNDCTRWTFHVAVKLKVKKNQSVEDVIIDPSLFPDRPVTEKEWLEACHKKSCYTSEYEWLSAISHTKETNGDVFNLTIPKEKVIKDPEYEITDYVCQNVTNPFWKNEYIELVRKYNPQL